MLIRNPEQAFNLGETASGEPQLYLTRRSMPPSEVTHQHRCARLPDAERPKRRRTVRLTMADYGAVAFLLMLIIAVAAHGSLYAREPREVPTSNLHQASAARKLTHLERVPADPMIRSFVGLSENAWDFSQPYTIAGFGPLPAEPRDAEGSQLPPQ